MACYETLAILRRDGFASMHSNWTHRDLLTRPFRFTQGDTLYVNAAAEEGYVAAELLDASGQTIEGYELQDCIPAGQDATCQTLSFQGGDLSALRGQALRIRFHAVKAELYAFWIGKGPQGASGGYLAGGGRAYGSSRDL